MIPATDRPNGSTRPHGGVGDACGCGRDRTGPPPTTTAATATGPASSGAPSCHGDGPGAGAGAGAPVVALLGAPNVGKSTLFNAITGARRTVGNWPGTTVEVGRGVWPTRSGADEPWTVLDLPGAYSLDPHSPDEALTRDIVLGAGAGADPQEVPDVAVVAVDAAHLARSLHLVAQLRERHVPTVVALTMADVARRRGVGVDVAALAAYLGCAVVPVDPRRRRGIADLAAQVGALLSHGADASRADAARADDSATLDTAARADRSETAAPQLDDLAAADARFTWIDGAVAAATSRDAGAAEPRSDRIDRIVTAPVLGPLIFLAVMWAVFQITTTVAAPLQDALDGFFTGPVTDAARGMLGAIGLGATPVAGFVTDGLIAGVGMLLTFAPLMALMFLLLALLEDSGYMARAAVVTDRLMRRLGLPGQAFLPLVVGFGCNVPAISATRILGDARQRLLVALLVPFTSCSARLTVYVMLASVFFPDHAGTVVFAMYLTSIVLVVLVGMALRSTLWRTMGADPLVLHLPPYQAPTLRLTLAVTWTRLEGFLRTAGGIIVLTVSLVWLLQQIPAGGAAGGGFGAVDVADSVYGVFAQAISPLFAPAGFDQWQSVSALIVGFVAKEAVISSWAQTYAVSDVDSGAGAQALAGHIQAAFEASSGGHTVAAVLAFMVFLLAYTPCVATLAAQRREIGWRWTGFGILVQVSTAYALAVLVFQIGSRIGG